MRVRAGKHVRILHAGMYFKLPVLDSATVLPIRRRMFTASLQTLTSKDRQPITVGVGIAYQIDDVLKVFNTIHNVEGTLATWAQGAIGKVVSEHDVLEIKPALLLRAIRDEIKPEEKGLGQFEAYITDLASLPGRTFRLIQEGRWTHSESIDAMGREA